MKLTNKFNLPKNITSAIDRDSHKGGFMSASQITKSTRQFYLDKRHTDEIQRDYSDFLYTIMGTAMHEFFEKKTPENMIPEKYLEKEIDGKIFSGTSDLYDKENKKIIDYKETSVWTIIYNSHAEDWKLQLNAYAYLYRLKGYEVENIEVHARLRDWSQKDAEEKDNYPPCQLHVMKIDVMPNEEIEKIIIKKVRELIKYETADDHSLPRCDDTFIWKDVDKYAVKVPKRKTALRVFNSLEEAEEYAMDNFVDGMFIEKRPGLAKRCRKWCDYCGYCNQYADMLKKGLIA